MAMGSAFLMGAGMPFLSVSTTLLIGFGCFVLGFFLAGDKKGQGVFPFLSYRSKTLAAKYRAPAAAKVEVNNAIGTKQKKPSLEIENLAEILEDFKMVLVVRNDLKMGKGKIGAQCSHATLGLYKKLVNRAPKSLSRWEDCGQVKVVVKIESEEDLLVLQERAKLLKLPTHITIDAGRTQIAPIEFQDGDGYTWTR